MEQRKTVFVKCRFDGLVLWRDRASTCFASSGDNSKPSIASFHFYLFTITWGICFSLEG